MSDQGHYGESFMQNTSPRGMAGVSDQGRYGQSSMQNTSQLGMAGGPVRETQVGEALGAINRAIREAHSAFDALRTRLDTVLRPEPPTASTQPDKLRAEPTAPLAQQLDAIRIDINSLEQRIRSTFERCEL